MPSDAPIADIVLHPVRMRIIHQLDGRSMTTAQLREALPDVKQATLYRHVSALLDAEVLRVVRERPVRGTTERTLALGERMAHVEQQELLAMDQAQLRAAFLTFLSALTREFEELLEADDAELRGFLGFGSGPLYVDEDDLRALQSDINGLLAPYRERVRGSQRRVTFATALLPDASGRHGPATGPGGAPGRDGKGEDPPPHPAG